MAVAAAFASAPRLRMCSAPSNGMQFVLWSFCQVLLSCPGLVARSSLRIG